MRRFHSLLCWRWSEEKVRWQIRTCKSNFVHAVAFSPDGNSVAFASGNLVKFWNVETGAEVSSFVPVCRSWWGGGVFFYFDIAQALYSKWSEERVGWQVRTLTGHWDTVHTLAFSADGKRIVSGTFDGRLQIWDAETGAEVSELV